jgi:polysaccharide export outer membrane protein
MSVALLCSVSGAAEQPKSKKQAGDQAKAPVPADSAAHAVGAPGSDTKTYIIGAEDVLAIRVWNEQQLTSAYIVRPDGKISMSLVGDIPAAGLTPEKLGQGITEALSKYINHPDVSVSVTQINSKKYFIVGETRKTGAFPLLIPTTVMEALAQSGGFNDFAKKNKIVIVRGAQRFQFNYSEVLKGKHREQNILLEPGDQINVP